MYDTILVPTDDGPGMGRVVAEALELASLTGATIHAISVVDPDGGNETAAERAVARVTQRAIDSDIPSASTVREGRPADTIVDYAEETDADLVVMGTHGRTGVDRLVLGSVAERVVRLARVPVLTVRTDEGWLAVADAEEAVAVAERTLAAADHELDAILEEPYREFSTWIVRTATADGETYNVHVDATSGEARLARIGNRDGSGADR